MVGVLPVIHFWNDELAEKGADLAAAAGCAGVVLIHMSGDDQLLSRPARAIKQRHPGLLVGTNRLSTPPDEALFADAMMGLDFHWIDNPGVYSDRVSRTAQKIHRAFIDARDVNPDFRIFGSVAFKTQKPEPDPAGAARQAAAFEPRWVVTTSGMATGVAPDLKKLADMKAALPVGAELAVASGVTAENAIEIARHVDWILVATGIQKSFHEIDPARLQALMQAVA